MTDTSTPRHRVDRTHRGRRGARRRPGRRRWSERLRGRRGRRRRRGQARASAVPPTRRTGWRRARSWASPARPRCTGRSNRSASRSRTSGASTRTSTCSSSTAREGQVWFRPPRDPEQAVAVAQDFMRHLATWHATPARELELPSFGPVRSVPEHQRDQLAGIAGAVRARGPRRSPSTRSPRAQLEHLLHHVPDVRRRARARPGRHRPRQLHVRRRPRHRDRRLGARARRRPDGRHRLVVVARHAAGLARLPRAAP